MEQAIILEEFGKGLVVEPFLPVAVLATQVLATAGATGAAAGLLADIGTGAALPVLAHGEVDAGGEIAFVETSAKASACSCCNRAIPASSASTCASRTAAGHPKSCWTGPRSGLIG